MKSPIIIVVGDKVVSVKPGTFAVVDVTSNSNAHRTVGRVFAVALDPLDLVAEVVRCRVEEKVSAKIFLFA